MKRIAFCMGLLTCSASATAQEFEIVQCQREDGYHVIFEERVCPVGDGNYIGVTFMSYSTYGRFMDWEPVSYMSFPYPVGICQNGFVVDRGDDEFSDELITTRMEAIRSSEYQSLSSGHTSFWLYYNLMSLTDERPEDRWWLALQSTWEADMCQNGQYETYVRATIEEMDSAVSAMSPDDELFTVLNFLRANMRRRIEGFDAAAQIIEQFRADHSALITENWGEAFLRLETAIADQVTDQLPLHEPEND